MSIGISVILGLAALLALISRFRRPKYPLPPGPKPWPIIGNALDMPSVRPWETYREWCKRYDSDIIHVHVPSQPAVILGSVTAAIDLFEKRSQLYSDRIRYVVAEMMNYEYNTVIMPYDGQWRAHRKLFHQHFQQSVVHNYIPIQTRQIRNFLSLVLESPEKTPDHARFAATSIIVEITYGKQVASMGEHYVFTAEMGVKGFSECMLPGVYLAEFMPFLKYLPSWAPGAAITGRKVAEKYLPFVVEARDKPYAVVQAEVAAGIAPPCVATSLCEEVRAANGGVAEHEVVRNVTALAFLAASDTTTSSMQAFLLAMALFPEVQKKAQAQLDGVIGPNRLPDFDDIAKLPYIKAVAMETTRWMPVVPFGVPHAVTADDTYKGYHIAKGTVLIPNTWAMMKNPEEYPDPDAFKPERFLDESGGINPNVRDPYTMAFGFGRRICPGRPLSANSLVLFAASTLHVFDITPGLDASGNEVKLSTEMEGLLVIGPKDVPHGLKPRSETAVRLIREAAPAAQ